MILLWRTIAFKRFSSATVQTITKDMLCFFFFFSFFSPLCKYLWHFAYSFGFSAAQGRFVYLRWFLIWKLTKGAKLCSKLIFHDRLLRDFPQAITICINKKHRIGDIYELSVFFDSNAKSNQNFYKFALNFYMSSNSHNLYLEHWIWKYWKSLGIYFKLQRSFVYVNGSLKTWTCY